MAPALLSAFLVLTEGTKTIFNQISLFEQGKSWKHWSRHVHVGKANLPCSYAHPALAHNRSTDGFFWAAIEHCGPPTDAFTAIAVSKVCMRARRICKRSSFSFLSKKWKFNFCKLVSPTCAHCTIGCSEYRWLCWAANQHGWPPADDSTITAWVDGACVHSRFAKNWVPIPCQKN